MAVPSVITDLNVVAASNSPAGTDPIGSSLDDYLRATQSIVRREQAQGASMASAATVSIAGNTDGNYIHITGTTTITSLGSSSAGISRTLVFDGALTLTHNATSLILPGGINITTVAGDIAEFVCEGTSNWRCVKYIAAKDPARGLAFSAYQSSTQAVSSITFTKMQFQTEDFDTAAAFDNATNYRFTPLVAGYYQISAGAGFVGSPATQVIASIFKNGTRFKDGSIGNSSSINSSVSSLVYLNGTTDYVEIFTYLGTGQNSTAQQYQTYFNGALIRTA